MMTRRAASVELQMKLQNALEELKASREHCNQLMLEHEHSELEIKQAIDRNTQLKAELAELHCTHSAVLLERDQLREAVASFNECLETYEEALSKISQLESELMSAQVLIDDLQVQLDNCAFQQTDCLYNELFPYEYVECEYELLDLPSNPPQIVNLDLKCESSSLLNSDSQSCKIHLSRNKFKKYIKLNKFIRNALKLKKKETTYRNQRRQLLKKLNNYHIVAEDNRKNMHLI